MNKDKLITEINKHNKAYWQDNDPLIPDTEYDLLVSELKKLDPTHELVNYKGSAVTSRGKVTHDIPMLSLDKAYELDEVLRWATKVARGPEEIFCINPKFDGLAANFDGTTLATRGDGTTGEDISDKISFIRNLSEGRGEIVIMKSQKPEKYKTARAASAGLVNAMVSDENTSLLTFYPYTAEVEECTLAELGDVDWQGSMLNTMEEDFPTDGIVLSLKDRKYGDSLDFTDHHPLHSIAFKYGNPSGITKLISVTWQVGKGKLTPVGHVEPVEIDGYTNTKLSLHNFDEASRVKVGDKIEIERCGQVIPQLKRVVATYKKSKEISCPICPACGAHTVYDSPNLKCPNSTCGGMQAKKLHDSLVRLGVENIGPATCSDLVKEGYDSLTLVIQMDEADWRSLPGFAEKSAKQRHSDIKSRLAPPVEDYRLLAALNIEGVGLSLSKKICNTLTLQSAEDTEDFSFIEGIGGVTSDKLVDGLGHEWRLLRFFRNNMQIIETKGLADRPKICFTGKSDTTRDEWIKLAEAKGYTFHNGVTKALALLVCSDPESGSTKLKKAIKYKTRIMTYEEFQQEKV